MSTVLQATGLTKDFGNNRGIFDVDLTVNAGEIVGFVGPNGAGKSTTINLLAGLVKADRGTITLFGQTVTSTSIYKLMPQIGLLLSESTLDQHSTAAKTFRQNQELLGRGNDAAWQDMAKSLSLDVNKPIKKLSLGNKKKVGVINALQHQPKLVIMDEPTSGLDPIIQAKFSQMLRHITKSGGAVFLSSHDLDEIQHVCDRIVMIRGGKVILVDSTESLLEKASKVFTLKHPPAALVSKIKATFPNLTTKHSNSDLIVYTTEYRELIKLLAGQKFYDFLVERPNLEEMFKEYYEQA